MSNIWKNLGASSTGDELIEKLEGLKAEICDSRNWPDDVTKTHANFAADKIEFIISKIKKNDPKSSNDVERMNVYE